VRKAVKKLGSVENLAVCYEAGPCGYVLYWQLTELGVRCEVVAPTLVPMRSDDRVKTTGRRYSTHAIVSSGSSAPSTPRSRERRRRCRR
jgi:hypothetical protein